MRRLTSATPAAGASMMRELSRSSDSSRTNSREMLEVVLHKKDDDERLTPHHHHHQHQHHMQQLHQLRSTDSGPRLSPMLLRTPHLQQNNNLGDFSRGPSSFSRKSLSRQSLDSNSHISDVCDDRENHQHHHHQHDDGTGCACASGTGIFLHSLGLLAVASLILSAMSLLLLSAVSQAVDTGNSNHHYSVGATRSPSPNDDSAKREPPESYKVATASSGSDVKISSTSSKSQAVGKGWGAAEGFTLTGQTLATTADQIPVPDTRNALGRFAGTQSLIEASVAMTTLVVVANLCCLMVCCMQCFFAAKLLKTYEGEARSAKYLRECSSSRFIAVMGFFLSIPAFLVALVLACMLHLPAGPALTTGVMLGVGVLFCVLSVMQNVYHWRVEKSQADEGVPVYHSRVPPPSRQGGGLVPPLPPLTPSQPHSHQHHHHHHADHGDLNSAQQNELSTLV